MKEKYIFYSAQTQHENLGDRIINRELLKQLASYGKVFVNVNNCPISYQEELANTGANLISCSFKSMVLRMARLTLLSDKVIFVMKPGHFFGSDGGLTKRILGLALFFFWRLIGIDVCRFGCSVGPYEKSIEIIEKFRSYFMRVYSVRESISEIYARSIGVNKVTRCPDMAFLLLKSMNTIEINTRRDFVISFRAGTLGVNDYKYLDGVVRKLKGLRDRGIINEDNTIFLSQVVMDAEANDYISAELGFNNARSLVYSESNETSIFELYGCSGFVLSNRLHVLLFAMSQGAIPIPMVDVSGHNKITGIFSDIGLEKLLFDLDGERSAEQHFELIINDKSAISNQIKNLFEVEAIKIHNTIKLALGS
ncbi:polysaccharide pyruvyl transferase family protein [Methylomicrobium sp. RS1]|uniref:polysaccharide pyruvyl transferase family protein n=1 Tax=Candidatus Methylomicrobium oryzae TaxID=2802053 RepID=UPI001921E79A|nr:polysaccharide pyruvyl transferase family protein [Methylomicrobium sp. RS1]